MQALDSADTTKIPQPANTDLILYILDQMQSEDLSGSLFDHQVEKCSMQLVIKALQTCHMFSKCEIQKCRS